MAALRLVSEARRHCLLSKQPPLLRLRTLLFSTESDQSQPNPSSSDDQPQPQPPRRSVPVQPVSYAAKPQPQQQPQSPSDMTREDARFLKDAPSPFPVSYAARVAPLPDDRAPASAAELAPPPEMRPTEVLRRRPRGYSWKKAEDDAAAAAAPFPLLLMPKKKETRPVLDLMDAIRQVKASGKCNFDETVEAHVKLGIDAKRAGKGVRGTMRLPHGSGKVVRVAYFAEGKLAEEARAAGADIVGGVELIEEIANTKKLNVDKCFATNEMILRMGKISRILRERGLWPDRKLGTVTNDIVAAVNKVRQGHIEFKMDKTAIVHVGIGKVSYSEEYIRENIGAFVSSLLLAKPTGLKKTSKYAGFINSVHLCSTMGPGFAVSVQSVTKAVDQYNKLQLK